MDRYGKYGIGARDVLYLQKTLRKCLEDEETLSRVFYEQLFKDNPNVRRLFTDNMTHHRNMFSTMLAGAAAELLNPEALAPLIARVGTHHRTKGVKLGTLEMGRQPFLSAIKSCIGDLEFDHNEERWSKLYSLLIDAMQTGFLKA